MEAEKARQSKGHMIAVARQFDAMLNAEAEEEAKTPKKHFQALVQKFTVEMHEKRSLDLRDRLRRGDVAITPESRDQGQKVDFKS